MHGQLGNDVFDVFKYVGVTKMRSLIAKQGSALNTYMQSQTVNANLQKSELNLIDGPTNKFEVAGWVDYDLAGDKGQTEGLRIIKGLHEAWLKDYPVT